MRMLVLAALFSLGSCSSPPKPPRVDESHKHPANAVAAVELQACKGELHNVRIASAEESRLVESARAASARRAAASASAAATEATAVATRSTVYTILFPFGGTKVDLSPERAQELVRAAQDAPWIVLSGRTDGSAETPAESRVARARAQAVRTYLIGRGVSPARIRATWQPVGDPVADNTSPAGRALNRRVEIEIYRSAPRFAPPDGANRS